MRLVLSLAILACLCSLSAAEAREDDSDIEGKVLQFKLIDPKTKSEKKGAFRFDDGKLFEKKKRVADVKRQAQRFIVDFNESAQLDGIATVTRVSKGALTGTFRDREGKQYRIEFRIGED